MSEEEKAALVRENEILKLQIQREERVKYLNRLKAENGSPSQTVATAPQRPKEHGKAHALGKALLGWVDNITRPRPGRYLPPPDESKKASS